MSTQPNRINFNELANQRKISSILFAVLLNWGPIFFSVYLIARVPSWISYSLCFMVVAIHQHTLNLCLHEGTHWLYTKNKKLNDILVTWFFSAPLLMPLRSVRWIHFEHHRHMGLDSDTKDVIFNSIKGSQLLFLFIFYGLGFRFIYRGYQLFLSEPTLKCSHKPPKIKVREWVPTLVTQFLLLIFFYTVTHTWVSYFLFWLLPYMTLTQFIKALRAIGEHQPLKSDPKHPYVRTVKPSLIDRFIFLRMGFDYHWEHHHYPSVPHFNLRKMRPDRETDLSFMGVLWNLFLGR